MFKPNQNLKEAKYGHFEMFPYKIVDAWLIYLS